MTLNIVAGDIGGTKTNLAYFEVVDGELLMMSQRYYASQEFATFEEILADFIEHLDFIKIDAVCFGVAGPVIDGSCSTTNLPWEFHTYSLKQTLQTTHLYLLNDLEATAYGMLYLNEDDFITLNPSAVARDANKVVIAAGTGLGEATLVWDGHGYFPRGGEGGHCDFAPTTSQQDALLVWMRHKYGGHVSYERILSGPGISAVYDFLSESGFAPQPSQMRNISQVDDRSAIISSLAQHDPLCKETMRLFVEIYGAEAGNLALKTMALGGIYIGGGIAPKILPFMRDELFMNAFADKGRFGTMLREIPVKISINTQTALLGAVHFAADHKMNGINKTHT